MFYRKNVGARERVLRALAGGLMIVSGLVAMRMSPWGGVLVAAGVGSLFTGAVGFCPACAMVGRQLPPPRP